MEKSRGGGSFFRRRKKLGRVEVRIRNRFWWGIRRGGGGSEGKKDERRKKGYRESAIPLQPAPPPAFPLSLSLSLRASGSEKFTGCSRRYRSARAFIGARDASRGNAL